jgi:hypothetical protein
VFEKRISMDKNQEEFLLLNRELFRTRKLLREINFNHLKRLTNDLKRHIGDNELCASGAPINAG